MNRQLLHYEAKATPWLPLLFGPGLALVFAFLASTRDPYLASRLNLTRVALLCFARLLTVAGRLTPTSRNLHLDQAGPWTRQLLDAIHRVWTASSLTVTGAHLIQPAL